MTPSGVFLNVIPVKFAAGAKLAITFAFLDQGSIATLCDRRLLDLLGIGSEDADFTISTVNGQSSMHREIKRKLKTAINV